MPKNYVLSGKKKNFFAVACSILPRRAFKEKKEEFKIQNSKFKIQNEDPSVLRTPPLKQGRSKKNRTAEFAEKGRRVDGGLKNGGIIKHVIPRLAKQGDGNLLQKRFANCALTKFSSSRLGKASKLPLLALAASVAAFLRNFFGKSCKEKIYITKHKIIITTKIYPRT